MITGAWRTIGVSTLLMIIFVPLFFAAIFAAAPPLLRVALILGGTLWLLL